MVTTEGLNGRVSKTARVHTNDPERPVFTLTMNGAVKPYLEVTPRRSLFLMAGPQGPAEQSVRIAASEGERVKVLSVRGDLEGAVTHALTEIQPDREYELVVRSSPNKEPGRYSGHVDVFTDHPKMEKVAIHVNVDIRGEVLASPQTVFFGTVSKSRPGGADIRKRILVRRHNGKDLNLTHINVDETRYEVKVTQLQEGKSYELVVTPRLDRLEETTYRDELLLRTDLESQPVVSIPIMVTVVK